MENPLLLTILSDMNVTATFSLPTFKTTITRVSEGVKLTWNSNLPAGYLYGPHSLTVMNGQQTLFNGGHGLESALIDFDLFSLKGDEVLRGMFTEYDPFKGEWVKDYEWFEIKLNEFQNLKLETVDLGNGWGQSNWLGLILPFSNGWSFHLDLGWIHPILESENSVWIYDNTLGWYWTGANFFPFIYSNSAQQWYFIDLSNTTPNSRRYYDYQMQKWVVVNP
jgi:hypothetical protein